MTPAEAFFRQTSVVILNYNRGEDTLTTLRNLTREKTPWREIIVCDNASTDTSREQIKGFGKAVQLQALPRNVGVSGSNEGFAQASGEWILSLDDDSHPVIPTLASHAETILSSPADVGAIALSVRSENSPDGPPRSPLRHTTGFSGAGVLLRKRALAAIGGYDPDIFLFANELDWTCRAALAGFRVLQADGAVVIHRASPRERSSTRHAYFYTRNTFRWLLRYVPEKLRDVFVRRYLADVLTHTVLHRTTTYLRAVRELKDRKPPRTPLSEDEFSFFLPDLRAGFGYLR